MKELLNTNGQSRSIRLLWRWSLRTGIEEIYVQIAEEQVRIEEEQRIKEIVRFKNMVEHNYIIV